jgi:hypothetical protein
VTKYTYNDIIEAYVVSSDENGNFFQIDFSPNLATATKLQSVLVFLWMQLICM